VPQRCFNGHHGIDLEKFNAEMLTLLRKSACGRESMRDLMQNGVRLTYTYRGSDGRFLSLIELGNRPCGSA